MKRWRRHGVALGAALVAGLALLSVAQVEATPPDQVVRYLIQRNGDDIGTHQVRFVTSGSRSILEHTIRIRVRVLSVEVFHYDMSTRETWEGTRLLGLQSTTDRNGTALRIFARTSSRGLRIRNAERERVVVPVHAIPADPHWNVLNQRRTHMIEAEDGAVRRVQVSSPVRDHRMVAGRRVECQRYDVTGEHHAQLWYDGSGLLVAKEISAPDGSTVITTRL